MLFRSVVLSLAIISLHGVCGNSTADTVLPDAVRTAETKHLIEKRDTLKNFVDRLFFDDFEENDEDDMDDDEYEPVATTKKPGRYTRENDWPLTPKITQMVNKGFTDLYYALRAVLNKLTEIIQEVLETVQRWFSS